MIESNLPSVKNELDAFMFWLSENEISGDDKMEITNYFECYIEVFTAEELLTDVKKSGLFSMKMIDDRVMEILQDKDRQLKAKDETITQKWNEVRPLMEILQDKDREIKAKDKTISKKRKEVDMLKEENKKLKIERM